MKPKKTDKIPGPEEPARKRKERRERSAYPTESMRLIKQFCLCSILLLCLTASVCGAATVNENARQLTFGETGRTVGLALDRQTTTIRLTEGIDISLPDWARFTRALDYAPAPLSGLVALGKELAR
ncbi:MAG: hypothetical protein LBJ11_10535 [Oscillospiraceae bacterium]|jgi:hypothetical protein|nr:hypothetical protein [Oscillospiraceae bacterium]